MNDKPLFNFGLPVGEKRPGSMTGRYQPRLNGRTDYIELALAIRREQWMLYGDLASIKHFVYAMCYGASFANAIVPVAKAQGRSPLEIAMSYSLWQTSGDDLAGT